MISFSDIENRIELSGWQSVPEGPMALTLRSFSAEQDKYQMAALARQYPVGSRKDFRPHALRRVVLSEGLRRLQLLGVQNIYVETDSYRNTAFRLYESFDFQVIQDVLVYRKDY